MPEVMDVMNDIYLAYRIFKNTGDMKAYNNRIGELTKKYNGDLLYEGIVFAVGARISRELGL